MIICIYMYMYSGICIMNQSTHIAHKCHIRNIYVHVHVYIYIYTVHVHIACDYSSGRLNS